MYSAIAVLLVAMVVSSEARYYKEEQVYGNNPYEGFYVNKRLGRYPVETEDNNLNWPSALMEFSQFIGKCETVKTLVEMATLPMPTEDVIARACPLVNKVADWVLLASPEHILEAEKLFKNLFHIGQCANLLGEREILSVISKITKLGFNTDNDLENNVFIQQTDPMFRWCDRTFGNVDTQIKTFVTGLHNILEIVYDKATDLPMRRLKQVGTIDVIKKLLVDEKTGHYDRP